MARKQDYQSAFDVIGPIMMGPSSSHTAGAVKIGNAARTVLQSEPQKIVIHYYESFASTQGSRNRFSNYWWVNGFQHI